GRALPARGERRAEAAHDFLSRTTNGAFSSAPAYQHHLDGLAVVEVTTGGAYWTSAPPEPHLRRLLSTMFDDLCYGCEEIAFVGRHRGQRVIGIVHYPSVAVLSYSALLAYLDRLREEEGIEVQAMVVGQADTADHHRPQAYLERALADRGIALRVLPRQMDETGIMLATEEGAVRVVLAQHPDGRLVPLPLGAQTQEEHWVVMPEKQTMLLWDQLALRPKTAKPDANQPLDQPAQRIRPSGGRWLSLETPALAAGVLGWALARVEGWPAWVGIILLGLGVMVSAPRIWRRLRPQPSGHSQEPWRAFIRSELQENPPWTDGLYWKFRLIPGLGWVRAPKSHNKKLVGEAIKKLRELMGTRPAGREGLVIGFGQNPDEIVTARETFGWDFVHAVEYVNAGWQQRRVERAARYLAEQHYSPKRVALYHADARNLTSLIPTESIDGVYAANVIIKPYTGLEDLGVEIVRVLKPGGYAYLRVPRYPMAVLLEIFEGFGKVDAHQTERLKQWEVVFQKSGTIKGKTGSNSHSSVERSAQPSPPRSRRNKLRMLTWLVMLLGTGATAFSADAARDALRAAAKFMSENRFMWPGLILATHLIAGHAGSAWAESLSAAAMIPLLGWRGSSASLEAVRVPDGVAESMRWLATLPARERWEREQCAFDRGLTIDEFLSLSGIPTATLHERAALLDRAFQVSPESHQALLATDLPGLLRCAWNEHELLQAARQGRFAEYVTGRLQQAGESMSRPLLHPADPMTSQRLLDREVALADVLAALPKARASPESALMHDFLLGNRESPAGFLIPRQFLDDESAGIIVPIAWMRRGHVVHPGLALHRTLRRRS
ncbi:MAG: class I SAM-dependent methyltransferase, partial [Candidatus Omnitrophota bacterium]|nr:class I SAM-dependent methyltransferase [Candidatus Omnitrophota bacterium]